jgi:hypothetical protein
MSASFACFMSRTTPARQRSVHAIPRFLGHLVDEFRRFR